MKYEKEEECSFCGKPADSGSDIESTATGRCFHLICIGLAAGYVARDARTTPCLVEMVA